MEENMWEGNVSSAPLPLSALRLLVPPLRLVSAAVWRTIQQKDVLNYGLLEEFVSMVVDIIPGLLTDRQRAQLILGLRARQILELCRLEPPADFETVQPHLDRMQMLIEAGGANAEVTQSNFVDIVQNLLKSSEEREHFFQKVFPGEFGPTYDDALHTLMWLFLSRLEKFLPLYTFQQVASMFLEVSSVLEDFMQSMSQSEGLKILLLSHPDDSESSFDGGCIISALKFSTVERTEPLKMQDNISKAALSVSEKELLNLPPAAQIKTGMTNKTNWTFGENEDSTRQEKNVDLTSQGEDASSNLKECHVKMKRLGTPASLHTRPVRQNRGQRIKMFLLEEKKGICESASRKSLKACPSLSDNKDSGSCNKDFSYMAPITTSSGDDPWSDDSDDCSHHSIVANSQAVCSGDESVNSPSEDESFSSCPDKDPSLKVSKNVPAARKKSDIKCQNRMPETQCFICKEPVNTSLTSHMKIHFPTGDYTCPQCDSRFKLMSSLQLHLNRTCFDYSQRHGNLEKADGWRNPYKCDKCEVAFRSKFSLQKHMLTHNELYCSVCRKVLRDAATVERHKASHTPFQCNRCEESFTFFKPLLKHCENIHKINPPFKCNHCPRTLPRLRFLIKHEWQHTGHLPFQCAQCSARFRSDTDLLSHQRVHTREKPYLCAECGKTFAHKSNLLRHQNFVHSKARIEKKHSCSQCDKSYKEKGALKNHQRRKHLHELFRNPCPYCGKMVSQSAMARHKLIHTGERPFKCTVPECDRSFRSTSEMKKHVLTHHTTDRPYKCDVCGKGFVKLGVLNTHAKIHSGEKPFACHICGKAFLKIYSMLRHKKLVHTIVTQ